MNRISSKILVVTLSALVLLLSVFVSILFYLERGQQSSNLAVQASHTAARVASILAAPCPGGVEQPAVTSESGSNIISLEMNKDYLAAVLLRNAQGKIVNGQVRQSDGTLTRFDKTEHLEMLRSQRLAKFCPVIVDDETVGTVDVYVSDRRFNRNMMRLAMLLGTGMLMVSLLVGLVLTAIVHAAVARPLAVIQSKLEKITNGDEDIQLPGAYPDELVSLTDSFETILVKQRLLVAILESTPDLVATSTTDGELTFINPAGQEILKSDSNELKQIRDAHPAWAYERVQKIGIPMAIRHGVWEGETALLSSTGAEIPVSQVIIAHKFQDGNIHYLSTIIRDISEQKKAAHELEMHRNRLEELVTERSEMLRQSEEEYRNLFEMSPIGLWRLRLSDSKFLRANAAACLILRVGDLSDLQGETLPFRPHDPERESQFRALMRSKGQVTDFEMPCRLADDSIRYFSLTAKLYPDEGYSEGAFIDITRRKQAEQKLEHAHKEVVATTRLAGMAEVATTVLHNVSNVLNSIGVISRTVKNSILTSKVNNLDRVCTLLSENEASLGTFLTESEQGRKLPEYLEKLSIHLAEQNEATMVLMDDLIKHVQHVKEIISVQQSSAKSSGMTDLCSIQDIINSVVQIVESGASKYRLNISAECEDMPLIIMDRNRVIQVLLNLASNARDSLKESDVAQRMIRIKARRSADGMLAIAVIDNGVGITAEQQEQIFRHGFTTKEDGHGFGLHGATKMAKALGGTLSFHSEGVGHGATFTLKIPVREGKAAA
jgi:PAS domain S-box-containing protein